MSQRFESVEERMRAAIQDNNPEEMRKLHLANQHIDLVQFFELAGHQRKADELFSAMLKIEHTRQRYLKYLFEKAVREGRSSTLDLLNTEFNYKTNDIKILVDLIQGNNPEIRDKVMAMHSSISGKLLAHSTEIRGRDPVDRASSKSDKAYLCALNELDKGMEAYVKTGARLLGWGWDPSYYTDYEFTIKKYVSALSAAVGKGDLPLVRALVENHHVSLTDKDIPLLPLVDPKSPNAYDMYFYILKEADKHLLMPRAFDACFKCALSRANPALMNVILEKYPENITSVQFDLYVAEYSAHPNVHVEEYDFDAAQLESDFDGAQYEYDSAVAQDAARYKDPDPEMLEKLYRSCPNLIDQQRVETAIQSANLQLLKAAKNVSVENFIFAAHQNDKTMWRVLIDDRALVFHNVWSSENPIEVIEKIIIFANEKSEEAKAGSAILLTTYLTLISRVHLYFPIKPNAWDDLPNNKEMFRGLLEYALGSFINDKSNPKIQAAAQNLKECIMGDGEPPLTAENAKLLSKTDSAKFIFSQFKLYEALYIKDFAAGLISTLVPPPQTTSSISLLFKSKKSNDPEVLAPLAQSLRRLAQEAQGQASVDNILKAVLDFYVMTYLQEKTSGDSGPILKKLEEIMKEFKLVELIEKSEHRNASKKETEFTVHRDTLDSKIFRYIAFNYSQEDRKKLFEQIGFSAIGWRENADANASPQTNPQVFANAVKIAERMPKGGKQEWNASVDTYLANNPLGALLKLNPDAKAHTEEKSIKTQFGKIAAESFSKAYQSINAQKSAQAAVVAPSAAAVSSAAPSASAAATTPRR